MRKEKTGSVVGLYPMPLVLVGVLAEGKPNWLLAGHVGIMGLDHIMVSLSQVHYSNHWIKESNVLSVNLVSEAMLAKADFAGCHSGRQYDKSDLFDIVTAANGSPLIAEAPVSMACKVEDIYPTKGFDNFILTVEETYTEECCLNNDGRPDFAKIQPVLFEKTSYQYIRTGAPIAKCRTLGK